MQELELHADNGEIIYATEVQGLEKVVFAVMNFNPKDYVVQVFREEEPDINATLEEVAPLHQEFYDTWKEAKFAGESAQWQINGGLFVYNPPKLPEDTGEFLI